MQAKKVEDSLMVCMTQFEARLLRQLLGSVEVDPNNPTINETVDHMSEVLINNDIYYAAPHVFTNKLKLSMTAAGTLYDQILEDGW